MSGELARRLGVSVVGVPVVLAAVWFGGWILALLLALCASMAAAEFYRMARHRGIAPFRVTGAAASAGLVVLAEVYGSYGAWAPGALALLILLLLGSVVAAVWLRWPVGEPVSAAAITVAGAIYTGGALSFAVFLRSLPEEVEGFSTVPWHGTVFLLLPILATWAGDTAAYFGGRAFGRRKLFPEASPGKTVAGGVSGLLGATLAAMILSLGALSRFETAGVGVGLAAVLGAALGTAAQLGDVAESVAKRWAGVKDSGTILPGHGGMLDRVDSLLLTFPLAYALLVLVGTTG